MLRSPVPSPLRPSGDPALGVKLAPPGHTPAPPQTPAGPARFPPAAGLKAPSARSRRGRPAPEDFSQPSTSFAIALLRIMAAAGNPNSPTGLREGGFILQHGTHSDKTRDFGGVGAAGRECGVSGRWNVGKTKHFPSVHAATPTAERGGSSELLSPRLQRSARHCQVRLPNPSTGEKRLKKKKKPTHHSTTVVSLSKPIKVLQAAKGSREMRRRNATSKLPSVRQRSQARGSRARHPRDPRRPGPGSQE